MAAMEIVKKIFHQLSWQMASKIVTAGATIILLSIITRSFGETGTGIYTLALTYLAFFYLATDMGLNGFYLGNYKDDPLLPNKLFNFRLWWSLILLLISTFALPFLPFSTTPFIFTVLIGAVSIVFNGF
jgi:O-antigen/teichoic acid export membrane protein